MIPEQTRTEILRRIRAAEAEHNVRVLYAVESGSRAWGFASANSDFDVRFIYARPTDWYLDINLENRRDVIEYEIVDEIDINGWDIRKALKLFWKSNPVFVEWLNSPIVYVDDGLFAKTARELVKGLFSLERGIYHYRNMIRSSYQGHLQKELVSLKKYFYALRPVFSVMWIEQKLEPPPIEFHRLREIMQEDEELNAEISKLLELKSLSQEKEFLKPIPILNDFIASELARLETISVERIPRQRNVELLNALFKSAIESTPA